MVRRILISKSSLNNKVNDWFKACYSFGGLINVAHGVTTSNTAIEYEFYSQDVQK